MEMVTTEREIRDLIEQYFECNSIKRIVKELSIPTALNFSTSEYVGITLSGYFDIDEPEYYGERKVQFCGFKNSIDNEFCGTISYEEFVKELTIRVDAYIKEHIEDEQEMKDNLSKIKKRLLG